MKKLNYSIISLGSISEIVLTSRISKHRFDNDVNSGICVETFDNAFQAQSFIDDSNCDDMVDEYVNNSGPYYMD